MTFIKRLMTFACVSVAFFAGLSSERAQAELPIPCSETAAGDGGEGALPDCATFRQEVIGQLKTRMNLLWRETIQKGRDPYATLQPGDAPGEGSMKSLVYACNPAPTQNFNLQPEIEVQETSRRDCGEAALVTGKAGCKKKILGIRIPTCIEASLDRRKAYREAGFFVGIGVYFWDRAIQKIETEMQGRSIAVSTLPAEVQADFEAALRSLRAIRISRTERRRCLEEAAASPRSQSCYASAAANQMSALWARILEFYVLELQGRASESLQSRHFVASPTVFSRALDRCKGARGSRGPNQCYREQYPRLLTEAASSIWQELFGGGASP